MMKSLIRNKTSRIESQGILKKRRKAKEINLILITEIRIDDNITQNVLIAAATAVQDSSVDSAFSLTPSPLQRHVGPYSRRLENVKIYKSHLIPFPSLIPYLCKYVRTPNSSASVNVYDMENCEENSS